MKRLALFTMALVCGAAWLSAGPAGSAAGGSASGVAPARGSVSSAGSPALAQYQSTRRISTRDRFKQIQMTLKAKGYNPGPIDGQWGSQSAAALKRFEGDHDLPADGKLDSLVLILLGLGPQRPNGNPISPAANP